MLVIHSISLLSFNFELLVAHVSFAQYFSLVVFIENRRSFVIVIDFGVCNSE